MVEVLIYRRKLRRSLDLSWKKIPSKLPKPLPKTEADVVIRHFGPLKLLDLYAEGETLTPVADLEAWIEAMEYAEPEIRRLWALSFPPHPLTHSAPALGLLIKVLHAKMEEERVVVEEEDSSRFLLSRFIARQLPALFDRLKLKAKDHETRLGFLRLQLLQLIRIIASLDDAEMHKILPDHHALSLAADLFFFYSRHSLFQHEFSSMIIQLIGSQSERAIDLLDDLFNHSNFLKRLLEDFKHETERSVSQRSPHFSHLTLIANQINSLQVADPKTKSLVAKTAPWADFVKFNGLLHQANALNAIPDDFRPRPEDYIKRPGKVGSDLSEPPMEKGGDDAEGGPHDDDNS